MFRRKIVAFSQFYPKGPLIHIWPGYFKILEKKPQSVSGLVSNGFGTCVGIVIDTEKAVVCAHSDTFEVAKDTARLLSKLKLKPTEQVTLVCAYNPFFKQENNPQNWKCNIEMFAKKNNIKVSLFFYAVSDICEKIAVTTSGQFLSINGPSVDTQFPKIASDLRLFDYVWDFKLREYPENTDVSSRFYTQNDPCFVMSMSKNPHEAEDRLDQKKWISMLRMLPINSEKIVKTIPIATIFWIGFLVGICKILEQLNRALTTSE